MATAFWLLDCGLCPVVISSPEDQHAPSPGKSPIGKGWGLERPTTENLRSVYNRHPEAGVGLALGPLGGVTDLEVDDMEGATPFFARLFGGEPPPTLGWQSARGVHLIYQWDSRLEGLSRSAVVHLDGSAVELRLGGHGKQVASVCPPSPFSEGRRREWNGIWDILPLPESLLEELGRRKAARSRPPAPRPVLNQSAERYAAAALHREVQQVREAQPGARNWTLNRAADYLGQLVASGMLERQVVEAELTDAALETGLSEREILATLRSGIEAGLLRPRTFRGRG
jgi:hypothetical protein